MENKKIKFPGIFNQDRIIVKIINKIMIDVIIMQIKINSDITY